MKPKLSVYLSDHVAESLALAASGLGSKMSAIVDAALDGFLKERDQSGDAALVRCLGRMSRPFGQMERDLLIKLKTLAIFVGCYLTMTRPLPSGDQDAARVFGRDSFEMFVAQIGKRIAALGRLVADVMEQVNNSNPDMFLRNLKECAPLEEPAAATDARSRAGEATDKPPEHFPEGREGIGDV